jgi:hypothetical protein
MVEKKTGRAIAKFIINTQVRRREQIALCTRGPSN